MYEEGRESSCCKKIERLGKQLECIHPSKLSRNVIQTFNLVIEGVQKNLAI
jgi:hypothetical protein